MGKTGNKPSMSAASVRSGVVGSGAAGVNKAMDRVSKAERVGGVIGSVVGGGPIGKAVGKAIGAAVGSASVNKSSSDGSSSAGKSSPKGGSSSSSGSVTRRAKGGMISAYGSTVKPQRFSGTY